MARQYILSQVWTEVICVLDDSTVIDSSFHMHIYETESCLAPGYYIALRQVEDGAIEGHVSNCHLIGPFEHRVAVDMLYASVLYFGATDIRQFIQTRLRRFSDMPMAPPALLAQGGYPSLPCKSL